MCCITLHTVKACCSTKSVEGMRTCGCLGTCLTQTLGKSGWGLPSAVIHQYLYNVKLPTKQFVGASTCHSGTGNFKWFIEGWHGFSSRMWVMPHLNICPPPHLSCFLRLGTIQNDVWNHESREYIASLDTYRIKQSIYNANTECRRYR